MIKKMYAILDTVSEVYMPPFLVPNEASAIRMIQDAHRNPQNDLAQHADDLVLYELGDYNDSNGMCEPLPCPKIINKITHIVGAPTVAVDNTKED